MIEELQQVDDSVLNSLLDLRRERDALRQRLARMQESASEVSEKVLARVRRDYEARIAAVEDKALPLKDAARADYGRLKPLLDQAQEDREALQLDQEEAELRHRLGEYDDDEHKARAAELGESLRVADDRIAEISAFLDRFGGAFDSPDELEPATTSQVDIPTLPEDESSPEEHRDDDGTLMLPPEPPPAPEPPPPSDSLEPPVWVASAAWADSKPLPAAAEEPWRAASLAPETEPGESDDPVSASEPSGGPRPAEIPDPEAATSGLPAQPEPASQARLEALDSDLESQPHYLEPLTFIGRTPENQIRIYKPAVSRRHAQISETDAGWLLRDLSSENGTYVNGQRITERLLAEGDRVQFGTSRFVVHLNT